MGQRVNPPPVNSRCAHQKELKIPSSASAMAAPLGHALAVRVEEGRHFPRDAGAAFRVAATFDDEPRSTVRL